MKPDHFLAHHSLFTREELSIALAGRSPATLDAYSLVNVRVGAQRDQWRGELFVENLFDEVADLFCCRLVDETAINRPRTIGLRLRYDF